MNDKNQRLFLAIALWLALYVGYMYFFGPKRPAPGAHPAATAAEAVAPATTPPPASAAPAADVPRGTSAAPTFPLKTVSMETANAKYLATSQGGALESIQLSGDKYTRHKGKKEESHVDLVQARAGEPLPFSTRVTSADGKTVLIPAEASYEVVKQDAESVTFRTGQGGLELTKTLRVNPKNYGVELSVELKSAAAMTGQLSILAGGHADEMPSGFFASRGNTPAQTLCVYGNNKAERVAVGAKHPEYAAEGAKLAGIDEQYFLTGFASPLPASCQLKSTGEKSGSLISALTIPLNLTAGVAQKIDFPGYAGPKDKDQLVAGGPIFAQSIDWGWWESIAEPLLLVMRFFQRWVPPHNWGIAIILLTIAIKLATFPLTHKQMKSMQEMQRIQPTIDAMKKKYEGDQQRQNVEMMKLYKEHGVNPMGSCLPMLIQMPIWFALYKTLQVSVDLYNAPFIKGWLDDLTAKDPYFVLPVLMGVTMVLTQILTPTPMGNPSQKTMGYVMSGFFSLLMLSLPSGLTLYIFTNNLLSIGQQMYLRRTMPPPPAGGQTLEVNASNVPRAKVHA